MRTWYEDSVEGVIRAGIEIWHRLHLRGGVRIEVAGIGKAALKTGIIEEGMVILGGRCNAPLYRSDYSSAQIVYRGRRSACDLAAKIAVA
jgi:hypothetical protein